MTRDFEAGVYVDVDDVLGATTERLVHLVRDMFGRAVAFEQIQSFDLGVSFGLSDDERDALLDAAHGEQFIQQVAPFAGAAGCLRRWCDEGQRIEIVTGRPPEALPATRDWLQQHGVPYHAIRSVDKYGRHDRAPGSETLDELATRRYGLALEDNADMAAFLARRIQTVLLFDRPWNRGHHFPADVAPRIQRVHSWREIEISALPETQVGDGP